MRYDEIKPRHVWYGTTKVLASDLILYGVDDEIHFSDSPEEAKERYEKDFGSTDGMIILEYKMTDEPKFIRVYSGVIDDPLAETNTNELDEFALGGLQRCTAVTVNALLKAFRLPLITLNEVPVDNPGVLRILTAKGLAYRPEKLISRTVLQFVNTHKFDAWYLLTPGHAMALIRDELFDAENKGADVRRLQAAFKITRR